MILNKIQQIFIKENFALSENDKLNLINWNHFDNSLTPNQYAIINNDMKVVKSYLRELKKGKYLTEFIYVLNFIKEKIERLNETLIDRGLYSEYENYLLNFESIKNKTIINNYLIKYIERYNKIAIDKNYNSVLQYQKKINLEYFIKEKPDLKKRHKTLIKWIEAIDNEIMFGKANNIFFADFDIHFYCKDLFLISLTEKKEIFLLELESIEFKLNKKNNINLFEPDSIDLSDTSAIEKIIYLQKLGVIDFLRTKQPFISSINSLATVLSAVTGAKSGTIQPMLNAMLSTNVNDKNNPLNSQKPTNKVTKQLIQIGFNLDETI